MKRTIVFVSLVLVGAAGLATAQQGSKPAAEAHKMLTPDAVTWGPAPPGLPPGAELAVLSGDPAAAQPFTIRAKLPAGYVVPPHWHPTTENVTVIQGTLLLGMGEKFDEAAMKALPVGSFAVMPKEMRHYAKAKDATVIQIHGIGPFEINYVNPKDDPRKTSTN